MNTPRLPPHPQAPQLPPSPDVMQEEPPRPAGGHEAKDAHAAGGHDLGFELPPPARVSKGKVVLVAAIGLAVLGAAFVVGLVPRLVAKHELAGEAAGNASPMPRVQVVSPKKIGADRELSLPGTLAPLEETIVYPRAVGYIHAWYKDLGDVVAEGDLLAEIDTPELDQQLRQAKAQLAQADAAILQAKANENFSRKNAERYVELNSQGIASKQDLEKQQAQADVDKASVVVAAANSAAMRANIQRLVELKGFGRVVAPFAGRVTMRAAERGNLVTEGTTTPLFRISATDPVRVIVQVPQDLAPTTTPGLTAKVTVREFQNRSFEGLVARTAGALDAQTRTMATEIRVPNPKGELLAGMYARVAFQLPAPRIIFEVPMTSLVVDAKGTRVMLVDDKDIAHYVPVTIDRDTGAAIEISGGLDGTERVVKLPSVSIQEGQKVEIAKPEDEAKGGAKK